MSRFESGQEADDLDLSGELDTACVWCECEVLDKHAVIINGRRFCADGCADEYAADVAEEDTDGEHGDAST